MGDYNPRFPQILGQEWVPIRDEDMTFSASVNEVEIGHQFFIRSAAATIDHARFYIHDWPDGGSNASQPYMVSIYGEDQEAQSGPIHSVIIPASAASITGTIAQPTMVDSLFRPHDSNSVLLDFDAAGGSELAVWFDTGQYNTLLNNKRILGVELLYNAYYFTGDDPTDNNWFVFIRNDSGNQSQFYASSAAGSLVAANDGTPPPISSIGLGGVTPLWTTSAITSASQLMPWTYGTLQKLDPGFGADRLHLHVLASANITNPSPPNLFLAYMALKVYYCEETREAVTCWTLGGTSQIMGAQILPTMRLPTFPHSSTVTLNPGNYVVTLSSPGLTDINTSDSSVVNALRQLYAIPPHPGVRVDIPSPLSQSEGKVITSEAGIMVLPQISLHTSSGPMTGVHVYGRQAIAQVYGTQEAQQEIYAGTSPYSQSYPLVRIIARRFGDTNVPLTISSSSFPSSLVSITAEEFDALDEIIDGWKEVTLEFDTPPTMGGTGTSPRWDISASGERVWNRWEVLGATAPAVSGIPGNLLNLVPSPNQLSVATYGAPVSGAQVNLTWIPQGGPYVSGMVDDQTSDAVIMFSVSPPAITGLSVIGASQAISGIGQNCGIDPCCIPTDIIYNEITWGLPVNTGYAYDFFNRTVVGGLGDADRGGSYTTSGGAATYSVNGIHALIQPLAASSDVFATLSSIGPDFDINARVGVHTEVVAGSTAESGLVGRFTDANNYYVVRVDDAVGGTTGFSMLKRVAGVETSLATAVINTTMNGDGYVNVRFMGFGQYLKAKAWPLLSPEPAAWDIEVTDTSLTTGASAGLFASNTPVSGNSMQYDNLLITPPRYWFGYYELQRMDELEDWKTIMKCTNPGVSIFNDYEARVGIQSDYRIRTVDTLGFEGEWSSTVSNTIPAPGVSGGCLDGGHVLIFTTNENQEGLYNLAYSNAWEGRVEEDFAFPEASFVQLQAMYDRDYFTAFRPTERGGERFNREILVQAAAIDPETLADFQSLRDMAWANVSYICVRDEDGNRWLATVVVPSGRVVHFRKIYLATVNVIETTDTPSPVDPGWP